MCCVMLEMHPTGKMLQGRGVEGKGEGRAVGWGHLHPTSRVSDEECELSPGYHCHSYQVLYGLHQPEASHDARLASERLLIRGD